MNLAIWVDIQRKHNVLCTSDSIKYINAKFPFTSLCTKFTPIMTQVNILQNTHNIYYISQPWRLDMQFDLCSTLLTHWGWDKMDTTLQMKCIFLKENAQISIQISLKFLGKCQINNIPVLIQIMTWCWPGDKPLSEWTKLILQTYIYAWLGLNELTAVLHAKLCKIMKQCFCCIFHYVLTLHGPLARYVKFRVRMRRECRERFPHHRG